MSIVTVSATFCFFTFVAAQAPIQFGLDNGDVGQRGLLATHLNKNPIGNESSGKLQEGRRSRRSHCCCISSRASCPGGGGGGGGGGSGGFIDFINPRDNLNRDGDTSTDPRSAGSRGDVTLRIVNRPVDDGPARGRNCRAGQQQCCYRNKKQLRRVSRTCTPITTAPQEHWQQGCREDLVRDGGQQCGRRNPEETVTVRGAEAKPNEFPWTCLLLNGNNDFLGSCAIVPSGRSNDISEGTDRVITAAHKLKDVQSGTLIKVRVLEYDARGFRRPETREHQEYVVRRFKLHPSYDPTRLSYDVAVLYLDRSIPLRNNPGVNAACFPPCSNMFDHRFSNGTGTRCWVAGWGKNEAGSRGKFQPIQNKVDVPLYPRGQCESAIRAAFRKRNKVAATNNFVLDPSELCAGGEQGKDACEGDGGSPLVCRSDTDTWYVVGIVTWGVGCADKNVPGVYANVYRMLDFITSRG